MSDRRTDARMLCAELVQVAYRETSGQHRRRVANLEDISLCGLCLQSEVRIPDGTRVVIRYGDGELVGVVKYCVFREIGFFLGIEFEPGCRWSTKHYRPEHLLDPRELVEKAARKDGPGNGVTIM